MLLQSSHTLPIITLGDYKYLDILYFSREGDLLNNHKCDTGAPHVWWETDVHQTDAPPPPCMNCPLLTYAGKWRTPLIPICGMVHPIYPILKKRSVSTEWTIGLLRYNIPLDKSIWWCYVLEIVLPWKGVCWECRTVHQLKSVIKG